jgi:hypothetical protein
MSDLGEKRTYALGNELPIEGGKYIARGLPSPSLGKPSTGKT